jgi:release factor glutamine methyltransferase
MERVAPQPEPASGTAGLLLARHTSPASDAADRTLLKLGQSLKEGGYRFTTTTPASHARVVSRAAKERPSLADIFGWSRPFAAGDVSETMLTRMTDAGVLAIAGPAFRSNVRFSTLGDQIFVHSSFPTDHADAVFFGPDTYRFARLIRHSLGSVTRHAVRARMRILDIGAGSGAGGLYAASLASRFAPVVTLADINRCALRFCKVNADLNSVPNVQTIESDLFAGVEGKFDLILANPPYLVDSLARLYRHGGGDLGFELSLKLAEQGVARLAAGGRLVLYTGSAIVDGADLLREALSSKLARPGIEFDYEEIDPDVFGEELDQSPYDRADRIAVVGVTIDAD